MIKMVFENYNPEKLMSLMDRGDFRIFVKSLSLTDEDLLILKNLRKEKENRDKQTPNPALECSLKIESDPENWGVYWNEYLKNRGELCQ